MCCLYPEKCGKTEAQTFSEAQLILLITFSQLNLLLCTFLKLINSLEALRSIVFHSSHLPHIRTTASPIWSVELYFNNWWRAVLLLIQTWFFILCLQNMVRPGKDPWLQLQQIVHYVKTKNYLDSVATSERSGIRKASANFVAEGKSFHP